MVLAEKEDFGLFDDVPEILDKTLTLDGKFVGRFGQRARCEEAVEKKKSARCLAERKGTGERPATTWV